MNDAWLGTAHACARASASGALALLAAWPLRAALTIDRPLAAALALLLATPCLAVAYAWNALAPSVLHSAAAAPWVLVVLLAARAVPLAWLVLRLAPARGLSPRAAHVLTLLPVGAPLRARGGRWSAHLRSGAVHAPLAAWLAATLAAFLDFELTARFMQPSWTVWLFDAMAGGVAWPALAGAAALPVGLALALAGGALALLRGGELPAPRSAERVRWRALLGASTALLCAVILPMALLLRDGAAQVVAALQPAATRSELLASVTYATFAALGALGLAARLRGAALWLACAPAMSGSTALGVALHALSPRPLLDTPLPLLCGLTLSLLPWAALSWRGVARLAPHRGLHVAALLAPLGAGQALAAGRLRDALLGRPRLAVFCLLWPLAQQDVALAAALAPPQWPPLTLRLHNLAHYGHGQTLSALLLAMSASAVLAVVAFDLLARAARRER